MFSHLRPGAIEHFDPTLFSLDADAYGNAYMSQGMPPYQIWRIRADGSGVDTFSRHIEFPEDAILIADIGVDRASGNVYSLLSCKAAGLQLVDRFRPQMANSWGFWAFRTSEALYSVLSISIEFRHLRPCLPQRRRLTPRGRMTGVGFGEYGSVGA